MVNILLFCLFLLIIIAFFLLANSEGAPVEGRTVVLIFYTAFVVLLTWSLTYINYHKSIIAYGVYKGYAYYDSSSGNLIWKNRELCLAIWGQGITCGTE